MEDELTDREKIISQATNWLIEMQQVDSEHVKNFLVLNIAASSRHIQDVDLLIDKPNKAMLIYIELTLWGRILRQQKKLHSFISDQISQTFPSFKHRIVFDKKIFDMALKNAENRKE